MFHETAPKTSCFRGGGITTPSVFQPGALKHFGPYADTLRAKNFRD